MTITDTRSVGPSNGRARLCLKARPTPAQLADRLRPLDGALPDGLELYLDAADIADQVAMDGVVRAIERHAALLPSDFALLIEGPVGSLDGEFFDVTRDCEADVLVIERLAGLARRLGVRAVNIHVITPSDDLSRLTLAHHDALLRRCVPFVRRFVELTCAAGAIPTVENMPPVLRMRQGGYYFTPIGMASADLLWLVEQVPGLALLPDTSHAGLYLNARRASGEGPAPSPALPRWGRESETPPPAGGRPGGGKELATDHWLGPLLDYVRQLPDEPADLLGYFQALAPHVVTAQIANAAGMLGEGLPYAEGDFVLDPVIRWLEREARYIVTETLEPNQDDARFMRDALQRMRAVLA